MIRSMKPCLSILVWTILLSTLSLFATAAQAFNNNWQAPAASDYQKAPPFVSYSVTPNVMIILDNSDSMNYYAYGQWSPGAVEMTYAADEADFKGPSYVDADKREEHYGLFDPQWFYAYEDDHFEVRYKKKSYSEADNTWQVVPANRVGGADENSNITSLSKSSIINNKLWDGNWLNWISMRRIDILRKVLVGGDTHDNRNSNSNGDQIIYARADGKIVDGGIRWIRSFTTGVTQAAVCPFAGTQKYRIVNGLIQRDTGFDTWGDSWNLNVRKQKIYEPEAFDENGKLVGVLQKAGDRAIWGNMWFEAHTEFDGKNEVMRSSGGLLSNPMGSSLGKIVADLEKKAPSTLTPLAETLVTVIDYFKQDRNRPVPSTNNYTMSPGGAGDPYYQLDAAGKYIEVPCRESYVLLLTDGASTDDQNVFGDYIGDDGDNNDESRTYDYYGSDYLDDVALYAHTTDLRDDLDGDQTLTLYTVYAFGNDVKAETLLQDAARNGGFKDVDRNKLPSGWDFDNNMLKEGGKAQAQAEWDSNGDDVPDNYFKASDGYLLERQIKNILTQLDTTPASGTAATVATTSATGEGAVYQSVFYPQFGNVKWVGGVNALFVDAYGNLREDSDGDGVLDTTDKEIENRDKFILVDTDTGTINRYVDSNGNGRLDTDETSGNLPEEDANCSLQDIEYLWSAGDWLNSAELDLTVTENRKYTDIDHQRHIFTFVDDGDMVVEDGEQQDFVAPTTLDWNAVTDPDKFYAYIHVYDQPFQTTGESKDVIAARIARVINFIRGQDQVADTVDNVPLPALRSRQHDYDGDGGAPPQTLRLGDIVHSTPTLVARPAENYDLIYRDKTYADFVRAHLNRRHVIYTGANDGMLHAFNGGFFDSASKAYLEQPLDDKGIADTKFAAHELGAELWAYVPFNLLPHLHWLTDPDYQHIYYMDLEPRIFDAKIYADSDSDDQGRRYNRDHPVHPHGWATLMVVGMRFGGGQIAVDIDKADGAYNREKDGEPLSSAYAIFDITNPEAEPELLGEVKFPRLGFTTCHPGVVPLRKLNELNEATTNEWYLVFGSGPIATTAALPDDAAGANNDALIDGTSSQKAVFYALDLVALANDKDRKVQLIDSAGKVVSYDPDADSYMVEFDEEKSSVSKPIAVDWDLDFNTDTVYFGTSFGDHESGWGGRLRRWVTDENGATPDSVMLDLDSATDNVHQPIMAPPTAAIDPDGNRWVFFGTGRYLSAKDKLNTTPQAFYGVKEPTTDPDKDGKYSFTYGQVAYGGLHDVSNKDIYLSGANSSFAQFNDVRLQVKEKAGWRMNFVEAGERNLGQAALLGGILTFTTYLPSTDICDCTGSSYLYVLHYLTGTAYYKECIGTFKAGEGEAFSKRVSLGESIALTPNIQVGRGESVRIFIQTGTGGIKKREEMNLPGRFKSGRSYWMPDIEECPEDEDDTEG